MKFTVEADCTPAEARAFLGLPDIAGINDQLVAEMSKRLSANVSMLQPDELMKTWMTLGGQAQEQFTRMMSAAGAAGVGTTPRR